MTKHRKIYYSFSILLVALSIVSIALFGFNFGIDFTGGSLMEVSLEESTPNNEEIQSSLSDLGVGDVVIQESGPRSVLLRFKEVDEPSHQQILSQIGTLGEFTEERFESIGPIIGEETKSKAIWAIALVLIMILIYIAWAFRKISYPLGSWVYGLVALVALFHDVIIVLGMFAILGSFLNVEIGVPFVAAILTILGYSVNDTIVVFDRIRENIIKRGSQFDFGEIIEGAVSQTYMRSANTSFTTFFVLAAIFFFGGVTIKYFVLTLMLGVVIGTYSSIFIASPLLVSIYRIKFKNNT